MTRPPLPALTLASGLICAAAVVAGPIPYWSAYFLETPLLGVGRSGPATLAALVGWGATGLLGMAGGVLTLAGAGPVVVLALQEPPDWGAVAAATLGGVLGGLSAVAGLFSALYAGAFVGMGGLVWLVGGA